jgi:CrcB protein
MWLSIAAISGGASLGALLRWLLGTRLNEQFPFIPPGTLAANLLGGYLIGVAVAFFARNPELPPEWRLFAITGFLGGLTTFSTFSSEVVSLLSESRWLLACAAIAVHVGGSLSMTLLGIASVQMLAK